MTKEKNIQTLMKQFWEALGIANDELNTFINTGMPSATEKRHKEFVKKWDRMKEKAAELCDQIEEQSDLTLEPVEINIPWKGSDFTKVWQEWKEYLAEQHNKRMKSRMERAALEHLKRLSEGKEAVAIEYLHFAIANGYPRFFKVTNKNYEQPTIVGGRSDGDF